jgi:hypothetical protein
LYWEEALLPVSLKKSIQGMEAKKKVIDTSSSCQIEVESAIARRTGKIDAPMLLTTKKLIDVWLVHLAESGQNRICLSLHMLLLKLYHIV